MPFKKMCINYAPNWIITAGTEKEVDAEAVYETIKFKENTGIILTWTDAEKITYEPVEE